MKNSHTHKNSSPEGADLQNAQKDRRAAEKGPKNSNPDTNPYDSENLDRESDAASKDLTEKDIEKDLKENDPSEGFETDIDKPKGSEAKSDAFETIQPDDGNPVNKEFAIGELGNEEIKEDEQTRDESDGGPAPFSKPSDRRF